MPTFAGGLSESPTSRVKTRSFDALVKLHNNNIADNPQPRHILEQKTLPRRQLLQNNKQNLQRHPIQSDLLQLKIKISIFE